MVVVTAGMHGNEPGGILAMQLVQQAFDQGDMHLKKGSILGLAGNLPALKEGVRFIQHDMNRVWITGQINDLQRHGLERARWQEEIQAVELMQEVEAWHQA
ncbi:succinylglutamate desuccinylase/aspartoacylase family protein, partial [Arthrospira platensis SPKY1]|nr:succinylglutamate desuccinylase/aspartoacylase family protein [Arthrospira platensis SPKY1]